MLELEIDKQFNKEKYGIKTLSVGIEYKEKIIFIILNIMKFMILPQLPSFLL